MGKLKYEVEGKAVDLSGESNLNLEAKKSLQADKLELDTIEKEVEIIKAKLNNGVDRTTLEPQIKQLNGRLQKVIFRTVKTYGNAFGLEVGSDESGALKVIVSE